MDTHTSKIKPQQLLQSKIVLLRARKHDPDDQERLPGATTDHSARGVMGKRVVERSSVLGFGP